MKNKGDPKVGKTQELKYPVSGSDSDKPPRLVPVEWIGAVHGPSLERYGPSECPEHGPCLVPYEEIGVVGSDTMEDGVECHLCRVEIVKSLRSVDFPFILKHFRDNRILDRSSY